MMLDNGVTLFESHPVDKCYSIKIYISKDFSREGELLLELLADGVSIYVFSFTIVPGHVLDMPDQRILLISRMQGRQGKYQQVRNATKEMHEISPQAVLFAALQGIARAIGAPQIIGVSATNHVAFSEEQVAVFTKAYDAFFMSLKAEGPRKGFYYASASTSHMQDGYGKPGHRLRTKLKRKIKEQISNSVALEWSKLFRQPEAAANLNGDLRQAPKNRFGPDSDFLLQCLKVREAQLAELATQNDLLRNDADLLRNKLNTIRSHISDLIAQDSKLHVSIYKTFRLAFQKCAIKKPLWLRHKTPSWLRVGKPSWMRITHPSRIDLH